MKDSFNNGVDAFGIRATCNTTASVAQWFGDDGAYYSYYMWHGGNNYGRTVASDITTVYADDVYLHSEGTPNQSKYKLNINFSFFYIYFIH